MNTTVSQAERVLHEGVDPRPEDFRPTRKKGLKVALVDGEAVVLDRASGWVHQMNRTLTYIWERCDGRHSSAQIAAQVCAFFEVDRETALRDVAEALAQLRQLKLLEGRRPMDRRNAARI